MTPCLCATTPDAYIQTGTPPSDRSSDLLKEALGLVVKRRHASIIEFAQARRVGDVLDAIILEEFGGPR